jgi:hypothetical protein
VGITVGPIGAASVNGFVAIAVGTAPVIYHDPMPNIGPWPMWVLDLGAAQPGMLLAPMRSWGPSQSTGMVSMGAPPAPLTGTMKIYWLPVWWLFLPCAGCVGGAVWARHRARRSGVCVGCGYSRAGLGSDAACPECGRVEQTSQSNPGPLPS